MFGNRSSPKIFDQFSHEICWIAQHNYGIGFMLHLLDDFLTVDPTSAGFVNFTSDASASVAANNMALQLRLVFAHRRFFRREQVFRDRTNPFDKFYEREMFERYRFGKDDLWKISDEMLGGELEFGSTRLGGTPDIVELLITLRILACGGFQLDIGDMFGITNATVGRLFHREVGIIAGRVT